MYRADYRVDLIKRPGTYLVIFDDRDAFTTLADHRRERRLPERRVAYVERQADHPVEQRAQWDELADSCLDADAEALNLLTYTAVSHGHAAYLARWEHAMAMAAHHMAEVLDSHLERGAREGGAGWGVAGWVAIRHADGSSDGVLYADAEGARNAQEHPEGYSIFPIGPAHRMTVRECEEHLKDMTQQRGC
jgi:hypothetical protein